MDKFNILKLNLLAPLYYAKDETLVPFKSNPFLGERLFCFEIDPVQSVQFEPPENLYPGSLLYSGRGETAFPSDTPAEEVNRVKLPQGSYIFTQAWRFLARKEFIYMVIELQKEGLWERLNLEPRIYLRYLHEEGRAVTQVFRPYVQGLVEP
jgi:hypothetical protein